MCDNSTTVFIPGSSTNRLVTRRRFFVSLYPTGFWTGGEIYIITASSSQTGDENRATKIRFVVVQVDCFRNQRNAERDQFYRLVFWWNWFSANLQNNIGTLLQILRFQLSSNPIRFGICARSHVRYIILPLWIPAITIQPVLPLYVSNALQVTCHLSNVKISEVSKT